MDQSFEDKPSENASQSAGKKRPQLQSPFTAATPKSRIGKEPKRPFGESPLAAITNKADINLEETAIETPTPPTENSSFSVANESCVDSNLEQTALMDQSVTFDRVPSSSSVRDLSLVEEGDETDADVTLAVTFAEQMAVDENGKKTPTPCTPKPTTDEVPPSETPTAPPTLAAFIRRADETLSSPLHSPKPVVDQSMHEFLMLEKESEYVVSERDLKMKINSLQAEIQAIHESRIFEEKALLQQINAIGMKAKSEKAAAQEKIRELEEKLEKAANGADDGEEKRKLEEQLSILTARVIELSEKSANVDEMKQGMLAYEDRLQVVMNDKLELNIALRESAEEKKYLLQLHQEGLNKIAELEAKLADNTGETASASDSAARIAEIEEDREEMRQMMINEISSLESQLDEARELLKKEQEKNSSTPQDDHHLKTQQLEEQVATAKAKIEELEKSASQFSSDFESLRQQHLTDMEEMQKKHANELQVLQDQFILAESKLGELAMKAGSVEDLTSQLTTSQQDLLESQKSLEDVQSKSKEDIKELQEKLAEAETALYVAMQDAGKLADLTTQLASAEQQISELKSLTASEDLQKKHAEEMQMLQEKHDSQLTAAQHLCAEVEASRLQISELTADLVNCQQQLDELRAELESTSNDRASKIGELSDNVSKVEVLNENILAYEARLESAMNDKLEVEAALNQTRAQNENLQKLHEDSISKIAELEKQLSESNDKVLVAAESSESAIREVQQEREELHEKLMQDVSSMEKQINELREQLTEAQSTKNEEQLAIATSRIAEMEQLSSQFASDFETLRQEHKNEVEELKKVHSNELETLRSQLMDAEAKLSEFAQNDGNMEKLSAQLEAAQHEVREFQSLVDELKKSRDAEVQMLRDQFGIAESALAAANQDSSKVEELTSQLAVAQQKIASLEMETNSEDLKMKHSEEIAALQHQLSFTEAQLSQNTAKAFQLQAQHSDMQQELAESILSLELIRKSRDEETRTLQEKLSAAESELSVTAEKMEELTAQLASAQQSIADLESSNASEDIVQKHAEEMKLLQEKYDSQITASEQLRAEVEESEAKISQLSAELTSCQNQLVVVRTEMEHTSNSYALVLAELSEKASKVEELKENILTLETRLESVLEDKLIVEKNMRVVVDENGFLKMSALKEAAKVSGLESNLAQINRQCEERQTEIASWKAQAQSIDVLTATLATMQTQLKEMSEKLEASDRRVIEVEETAKHDVTLMQEEVDGRQAELEEARHRISDLETSLERANREVARLEKVCDEFDDDESKLKEKISILEAEIKQLKGIKSPPKLMGLLQQARQGIKPLSRDSSRVEDQKDENKDDDDFEDAADSFVAKQPLQRTMLANATAVDSPNVSTAHPDDSMTSSSLKKANRSNCQQQ